MFFICYTCPRPPAHVWEQLNVFSTHFIRVSNSFLTIFDFLTTFWPFFTHFVRISCLFSTIANHFRTLHYILTHPRSFPLVFFYPFPPILLIFEFSPLIFNCFSTFFYVISRVFNPLHAYSINLAQVRSLPPVFQPHLYETAHFWLTDTCFRP